MISRIKSEGFELAASVISKLKLLGFHKKLPEEPYNIYGNISRM
jgi:hypothetical protein